MFGKKKSNNIDTSSVAPVNMSTTPSVATNPVETNVPQTVAVNVPAEQTQTPVVNQAVQSVPASNNQVPVQGTAVTQAQGTPAVVLPPERNEGNRATQYGGITQRATAYGNSANQSSGNYGTAVTTLGNIGNVDFSYNTGDTEKEGITPKKVVGAIMIIMFLVWAFFLYSDYDSAKNNKKPKYCFFGETVEEYDIGKITVNKGLGYKVVRYETEDTNLLEFSALWQKNKKLEDIGRQ